MLHQLCQLYEDEWRDDDDKLSRVIIASQDGRSYDFVDEECHRIFDAPSDDVARSSYETNYYDLRNVEPLCQRENSASEEVSESILNSIYERLKIVARKRRDFLVDLVVLFPSRPVTLSDD